MTRVRFRGRPPRDRACESCGDPIDQEERVSKKRFCPSCAEQRNQESSVASKHRRWIREDRCVENLR